ncbi:MAG: GNAT family N-acetyltransferase [Candidatus Babeliales bacterium]
MKNVFTSALTVLCCINISLAYAYEIKFKLLQDADLPLIYNWLHQPFVKKWFSREALPWQEFLTFREQIKSYLGTGHEYLACHNDHPFGYIRLYDAHLWLDGLGNADPEGTYGIDLYIGDAGYLGKGFGSAMLSQFITKSIKDQVELGKPITQIIVDPDSANVTAIKTYQRLGFTIDYQLDDPFWGNQLIMVLDPDLFEFLNDMHGFYEEDIVKNKSLEQLDTYLDNLFDKVLQRLACIGISYHDCENFLVQYGTILKSQIESKYAAHAQGLPLLSQETLCLVHQVLLDFEIDSRDIVLIAYTGKGSPVAADDYTLYIDEKELSCYTPEAQRFAIAHELMHFLHKDNSFESALENLMGEQKSKAQRNAFYTFAHANELCADIDAMLKNQVYATSGVAFLEQLKERFGSGASFTHPSADLRLNIAQQIQYLHEQLLKPNPSASQAIQLVF